MNAKIILAIALLFLSACKSPQDSFNSTTTLKSVTYAEKRELDDSPIWQVGAWGETAYFPSQKGFAFHSLRKTQDHVTVVWEGVDENLKPNNQEFNSKIHWAHRDGLMVLLTKVAKRTAEKDSQRCDGSYRTKELQVSGGGRFATVHHCARLKGVNLQEVTINLYANHPLVIYSAHWLQTLPPSASVDLADSMWQRRLDSMSDVIFCDSSVIPKRLREKCKSFAEMSENNPREYAK